MKDPVVFGRIRASAAHQLRLQRFDRFTQMKRRVCETEIAQRTNNQAVAEAILAQRVSKTFESFIQREENTRPCGLSSAISSTLARLHRCLVHGSCLMPPNVCDLALARTFSGSVFAGMYTHNLQVRK